MGAFPQSLLKAPDVAALLRDFSQWQNEEAAKRAKVDPSKHKLVRVFDPGVRANWRFFVAGKDGRNREVRFAWSVHRNAAGYFLGWREVVSQSQVKRDMWLARKVKQRCIEVAERRRDAFRAKRGAA